MIEAGKRYRVRDPKVAAIVGETVVAVGLRVDYFTHGMWDFQADGGRMFVMLPSEVEPLPDDAAPTGLTTDPAAAEAYNRAVQAWWHTPSKTTWLRSKSRQGRHLALIPAYQQEETMTATTKEIVFNINFSGRPLPVDRDVAERAAAQASDGPTIVAGRMYRVRDAEVRPELVGLAMMADAPCKEGAWSFICERRGGRWREILRPDEVEPVDAAPVSRRPCCGAAEGEYCRCRRPPRLAVMRSDGLIREGGEGVFIGIFAGEPDADGWASVAVCPPRADGVDVLDFLNGRTSETAHPTPDACTTCGAPVERGACTVFGHRVEAAEVSEVREVARIERGHRYRVVNDHGGRGGLAVDDEVEADQELREGVWLFYNRTRSATWALAPADVEPLPPAVGPYPCPHCEATVRPWHARDDGRVVCGACRRTVGQR